MYVCILILRMFYVDYGASYKTILVNYVDEWVFAILHFVTAINYGNVQCLENQIVCDRYIKYCVQK